MSDAVAALRAAREGREMKAELMRGVQVTICNHTAEAAILKRLDDLRVILRTEIAETAELVPTIKDLMAEADIPF
jgi:intracellular sulfur oxidation DsrE/DsrF family protein